MSRGSEQASKCDELGVTIMVTPGIPTEAKRHLGHISERPAALKKNKKKTWKNLSTGNENRLPSDLKPQHFRTGVSNIRPGGQNRPTKDSNLTHWKALENMKRHLKV